MNLYFLTEDSKSFCKVLPKWLSYSLPRFHEGSSLDSLKAPGDHYLVQSGYGYPSIKNRVAETIETIELMGIPLDHFIVCWDSEAQSEETIREERETFAAIFERYAVKYQYRLFVMRHCFETWLLGNRAAYPRGRPSEAFAPYAKFYDVAGSDPERMLKPKEFTGSVPMYHYRYLQIMLRESGYGNYSKRSPGIAKEAGYWKELCLRAGQALDLRSFADFWDFLRQCGKQSI